MNLNGVWKAIRARALADTGAGGLFETSNNLVKAFINHRLRPQGTSIAVTTVYPYVVYSVVAAVEDDTFEKDSVRMMVAFSVFDEIRNGVDRCEKVIDRIYGDAMAQATRLPTFGYHRHPLVIDAPWAATAMSRRESRQAEHKNVNQFIEMYEFWTYYI